MSFVSWAAKFLTFLLVINLTRWKMTMNEATFHIALLGLAVYYGWRKEQ